MENEYDIHVISKANIGEHKTISVSLRTSELAANHVRVRSAIISLTNNNLSYAQLGSVRNWWDTYPVPGGLQPPYNDADAYGIVPAWGYGEVLESRVAGIESGMLLWGFWPTADMPIDLNLTPADGVGQWVEHSAHRKELMNLYQRYYLFDAALRLPHAPIDELAWESAVRPTWEAGYLLSTAVFGKAHIHPLGVGERKAEDADLSSAVVISLSASGKTALGFQEALVNRQETADQPSGLLAVTSSASDKLLSKASFPTKVVSYEDMVGDETLAWLRDRTPRKVVVVDFGGRGDSLVRLHGAFKSHFSHVPIVVIGVGGNPSIRTMDDLGEWAQTNSSALNRIQMNTSGIKDVLLESEGADAYFKECSEAFSRFRSNSCVQHLRTELREGIKGDRGYEGGWTEILEGKVPSDVALAYRI
jgi:hypothetical protein